MSTIGLTQPLNLKSGTLVLGVDEFGAAVQSVKITPSVSSSSFTGIGGQVVQDTGVPTYVMSIELAQDLSSAGLLRYMWANIGQQKGFTFTPAAGGPAVSGTVVIVPPELGGASDGNIDVTSVTVPLVGAPAWSDVAAAPTVAGATPGGAAAGALVTITGTKFTGASAVKFGAVSATVYTVLSDSTIVAVMPAGTAGSAPVTVTNGTGTSNSFAYTRGA